MSKQDLKKNCNELECCNCPLNNTKYLCGVAETEHYISLIVILNEIKKEIEKVEKENR